MAEKMLVAEWSPHGPAFNSVAESSQSYLSVDYADGVDTRWDKTTLGPLLNTLDCAAAAGSSDPIVSFVVAPIAMQAAGPFLYGFGPTKWRKIALTGGTSALTLSSDGTETALGEAATGGLLVQNAAGTYEILVCMDNTAARIITAVGAGATDTDIAQTGGYKWRVAGFGDSDAAVQVVLLAGRGTGTVNNLVQQVALSGSTVLSTATPTLRATIAGPPFIPTSLAMDGDKVLLGTNRGVYFFNNQSSAFRPLIGLLPPDSGNGTPMVYWPTGLGSSVIIALAQSLRWNKNIINGGSFGPETYPENTSPVTGECTAFTYSPRWGYATFHNTKDDITYLCAIRNREAQDWQRGHPVSYFPLMSLGASVECHAALYTGIEGNTNRTRGLVAVARDTNIGWFDEGKKGADRFYQDTGYPYAATGTLYLTTMPFPPGYWGKISHFRLTTEDCDADETIELTVVTTDRYGNTHTTVIGSAITGNGTAELRARGASELIEIESVKPQLAFARGSTATNSPKIPPHGKLEMFYTLVPAEYN